MLKNNKIRPWLGWSNAWIIQVILAAWILSSHKNELWEEAWPFMITVCFDNNREFSVVLKRLHAAAGAEPFNCLSNFMGCMPGIRVSSYESLKNWIFVHDDSSNQIQQQCWKRVLQEKSLSGTGESIHAAFEEIHAGCCNEHTEHHIIENYLKRPHWKYSLAVQSKDCETTFESMALVHKFVRSTHQRHGSGMGLLIAWIQHKLRLL